MRFKIRFADQIVGFFVLVAIVAVAVILIFIGVNQRWFAKNYHFTSTFASGDGLSVGMSLNYKGFEIGKISGISLNGENEVDVRFYVQDTYYDRVKPDSVLELTSSPIGLGTSLKFHPGKNTLTPLAEGSFIPSMDSAEGQRRVLGGLVELQKDADVIGSVIAKLNPILDEARQAITEIRRLAGTADSALAGKSGPVGALLTDLSATPGKVNIAVDTISGSVNTAVDTITGRVNTLMDKISVISDNLTEISVKTSGVIGDLSTNLDVISQNIKDMTGDLKNTQGLAKRLLDPKGSVDTFLNDSNELYNQVDNAVKTANGIIAQVKSFVDFINASRPQVTSILEKGSDTLTSAQDVLQAAKNNPLLKGGVPAQADQSAPLSTYRDEKF